MRNLGVAGWFQLRISHNSRSDIGPGTVIWGLDWDWRFCCQDGSFQVGRKLRPSPCGPISTGLLECPPNTVADFIQSKRLEGARRKVILCDPAFEGTLCHFHNIYWSDLSARPVWRGLWEGTTESTNTKSHGSLGAILETGYHRSCLVVWTAATTTPASTFAWAIIMCKVLCKRLHIAHWIPTATLRSRVSHYSYFTDKETKAQRV